MTETRTPRFNLPQWSAGTDSPSRTDFNGAFSDIEGRGAYDNGDNVSSLPVSGLVAGRYSMLTVSGDGYSLYRYSGAAWQFVGGSLVPRFQRFKAIEGQLVTDAAFAVEHPDDTNANIIASYGGDFTAGGVLKSWNANDAAKGALVVGWNGAISLTTTGRAYLRTRADSELGLVLHAHGSGAGNMLTVREPGNSDILTVDAIGRFNQRTFAAFGGASMPSTSMVAIAPTSAVDSIISGLLLYGQSAAASKAILRAQRDNTTDTTPIMLVQRDAMNFGRLPWGTAGSGDSSLVTLAANTTYFRASGTPANTTYWAFRRSDPTSGATEANVSLDTTLVSVGPNGLVSGLPMAVSQRYKLTSATMSLYRVSDFTASFLDLGRLVPDGMGGENTQPAATWDSDGRLRTGAWWKATGTLRDARQSVTHLCTKRYTTLGAGFLTGQYIVRNTFIEYTWPVMTCRSSGEVDLDIQTIAEFILLQNPDGIDDAQQVQVDTYLKINAGAFSFVAGSETPLVSPSTVHRQGGGTLVSSHRAGPVSAGSTFQVKTRVTLGTAVPDAYLRMLDLKINECVFEIYTAS